jgi:hypothetical protein
VLVQHRKIMVVLPMLKCMYMHKDPITCASPGVQMPCIGRETRH